MKGVIKLIIEFKEIAKIKIFKQLTSILLFTVSVLVITAIAELVMKG